jgi:Na+-transporting methylmalonyl-CoA/oxaloacetate decarboxylase gamma subunit
MFETIMTVVMIFILILCVVIMILMGMCLYELYKDDLKEMNEHDKKGFQ